MSPGEDESHLPEVDSDFVHRWLANQQADLQLRAKELQIQEKEGQYAHEYSLKALDVQKEDRESQRAFYLKRRRFTYTFIAVLVLLLMSLLGFCFQTNHPEVAVEIIKAVAYLGAGFLGGQGAAKWRARAKSDESAGE